jgi:TBP-interacting protein
VIILSEIKELSVARRIERIGSHTHIKGLGLDENGKAIKIKDGMVGQERAREAAGLVVRMIKEGKLAGRLVILAGPPGTGKCVSGDTPVLLANGTIKPIKEIYEEYEKKGKIIKNSEDEKIIECKDLAVVSLNPSTLKVEKKNVLYLYKQKIKEKIIEIKTRSGRKIKVTKKHPLLTIKDGSVKFIEAKDLHVGDFIAVPRNIRIHPNDLIELNPEKEESANKFLQGIKEIIDDIEYSKFLYQQGFSINQISNNLGVNHETIRNWINYRLPYYESYIKLGNPFAILKSIKYSRTLPIEAPKIVTPELGEFFGYLISECDEYIYEKTRSYVIRFHNTNEELKRRFKKLAWEIFKIEAKEFKDRNTTGIRISSWNLKEFLEGINYEVGKKSPEKDIPEIILRSNDEVVSRFLRAFCDGEGSVNDQEIEISTSSEKIANKLAYLFLRFGIVVRIREKFIENKKYFRIIISGNHFLKEFKQKIGFSIPEKIKKLDELCNKKGNTNVDIIPNIQTLLADYRSKQGISKEKFYSSKNGYRYEKNKNISRNKLQEIVKNNDIKEEKIKILANSDVFWDKIKEMREVEEEEVYDLNVEDTQTFIAGFGGIIVHNTAIAVAIARELGLNVPFIEMSGAEVYSTERKKTEVLIEAMRKCIGIEIHEMREVYEGEVTKINIRTAPHPYNPYQRIVESATITLKTKEEERTIEVGEDIAAQLIQQGVKEGNVIQIDAESGRVSLIGISQESTLAKQYELDTKAKVPRPEGKVRKQKEFVYYVTLADLDKIAARRRGGIFSLFFGGSEEKEISPEIRIEVDRQVKEMIDEKKAFIHPGVLFIDDAHLLDLECFSFLSRAIEGELSPIVILATNRGFARIRGTDIEAPLGFPPDLLDRGIIIGTDTYDEESIREILKIRAIEENIEFEDQALERLTKIGHERSLRYAVQLLSIAAENAKIEGRKKITIKDVERVDGLFMDVSEAVEHLKKYEGLMMRH